MRIEEIGNDTVNLGVIDGISHEQLFHDVGVEVAKDNLAYVNEHDKKVVPRDTIYTRYIKRLIDIIVSLLALIVTLPVNLVIGIVTYFDVGHPIFFCQERLGKNEKKFTIVKFRNMTNATNELGELLPPDQRVTKFGKFVRRTSLDELLNFWSILKGDMSLIGPRPLVEQYMCRYSDRHKMRYAVRPGLECPNITKKDGEYTWADQFENEIYYVENVSFLLDMKMAFALVGMVFNRKKTKTRANAVRGSFIGYTKDGKSINSKEVPAEYVKRVAKLYEEAK